MNIIPWHRQRQSAMAPLAELEDFLARFWDGEENGMASHLPEVFRGRGAPAVNVAETEDAFHVTLDLPGMDKDDIRIQTMGGSLVVSGERKWEKETKKGREFRRVESRYGRFERAIPLPDNVRIDPDEIEASYKKGVLRIEVPKLEKTPAATIPIKGG